MWTTEKVLFSDYVPSRLVHEVLKTLDLQPLIYRAFLPLMVNIASHRVVRMKR